MIEVSTAFTFTNLQKNINSKAKRINNARDSISNQR
jgi:hypothetical protein